MRKLKITAAALTAVLFLISAGCGTEQTASAQTAETQTIQADTVSVTTVDVVTADYSDRDLDGTYDESEAVYVDLSSVEGDYTIAAGGVYVFSGTLRDGTIIVDAGEDDKVQIVLNGASVSSGDGPAIYAVSADKVFITAAEGTSNTLIDGDSYADDPYGNTPDGAVFAKCDLTINGSGTITIDGNYKFGVVGKDDVVIADVTLNVTAVSDGVSGKDSVSVSSGVITITAGGDGIVSVNKDDTEKGNVTIDGGTISITTGGAGADSAKGIKAQCALTINGGSVTIDAEDDALHSGESLNVTGGVLTLASGDDGMHCDDTLVISGGEITVSQSYEGIEASTITIAGGTIFVTASDDGLNAAGGADSSASGNDRWGGDSFASDASKQIIISGGTLTINASGDGIDSNGSLSVTGGSVFVSGPTDSGNGALDASPATISGGSVIAAGSTGMAVTFGSSSSQCSLMYTYQSVQSAGTLVTLTDSDGNVIVSFAPQKQYQNVVISASAMSDGETYLLYSGGSVSGGTLSGGTLVESITLSGVSTTYGSGGSTSRGGFDSQVPGDSQMPGGGQPSGGGRRG